MKKAKYCLLIVPVLLLLFALPVAAASAEDIIAEYEELLPESSSPLEAEGLIETVGLKNFLSELIATLEGQRSRILSFFSSLLAITLISSLCAYFSSSSSLFGHSDLLFAGCAAVCGAFLLESLNGVIGEVSLAIGELSGFFSAILPILTAITASGGGTASAGAQAGGMSLALSLVGTIASGVLLPLVTVIFALSFVGAIYSDNALSELSRLLKNSFGWILGILSFTFGCFLSLQTAIASAADSVAMRAAKYAASSIPVVGSTVAASVSSLASGLAYAKSAVGVSAVSVIVGISLSPILRISLFRASVAMCASVGGMFSSPISSYLSSVKGALDSLIGVFLFCGVIYTFQILLFMKCGVALL